MKRRRLADLDAEIDAGRNAWETAKVAALAALLTIRTVRFGASFRGAEGGSRCKAGADPQLYRQAVLLPGGARLPARLRIRHPS